MKLLIKGGLVVDPLGKIDPAADLLISEGKIEAVEKDIKYDGAQIIDATGKMVVPGLIDMHVHLREPGFEAKETIATGTRAAARGGFTSVACMPNTRPVADDQSVIKFICERAKETGVVNVFPIGAITKGSKGDELSEMADLKAYGAVAFSDDGFPVSRSDVMRRAMQYAKMVGLPIISHCEDKELASDGVMHEGYMSTVLGLKGIPAAAEEVMVARDIILAELTGCPLHLAHISTVGSVRLVREAKARGVAVTAEVTPHHFTLTDRAVAGYDTATKVNPPLRTDMDVAAVKEGLADGTIDVIATDHAPHTDEEKDVEYQYAPFGLVGLETAVGLVFTELIATGVLTPVEAIKKLTVNPARILGINKGTLAVGADADVTIIDPNIKEVVDVSQFETKGRNSPFIGRKLNGLPVMTIVNGNIVMHERKIIEK
ncbi:dihydroorotase [Desulfolucanica intricata]|uniref:dihydroorotase n=1 Tax=Desulfolucanica intricata TaxID=1285191 RepID=UPI000836BE55|nr:dihydroorotase [Desulfolucanica intricata]